MGALEIIAQARAAQIRRLEGLPPEEEEVFPKRVNLLGKCSPPKQMLIKRDLCFTRHARIRMSQRGISVEDVYSLYKFGEARDAGNGAVAYVASEASIQEAPPGPKARLRRLKGAKIVVTSNRLMTVVHDGEDTKIGGSR